ncbi:MAG: hypothetical protein DMF73_01610 [Acidobacteria bacterium]|nr:MAG: hypothetical protein DMF73_01610 [Acidobacteriota bacterium]
MKRTTLNCAGVVAGGWHQSGDRYFFGLAAFFFAVFFPVLLPPPFVPPGSPGPEPNSIVEGNVIVGFSFFFS